MEIPKPGIDLFCAKNQQNPYPAYSEMRRLGVCELEDGQIALARFPDVSFALMRHDLFSAGIAALVEPPWLRADCRRSMYILGMDPPIHTLHRAQVNKSFAARVVANLAPLLQGHASKFASQFDHGDELDFVEVFAFPYTNANMTSVLGAEIDLAELRSATEIRELNTPSSPNHEHIHRLEKVLLKQNAQLDEIIENKRLHPCDDLASVLVNLTVDGQPLSHEEVRSALDLFITAGFHTLGQLITNCVMLLSQCPVLHAKLAAEPARIPAFIDEVLRYCGPVQRILRASTGRIDMHGHTIPAGRLIAVFVAAANRDEDAFIAPDAFMLDRQKKSSLQFGHGAHRCIGSALALSETRIAIETLVTRFESVETPSMDNLQWISTMTTRGVRRCPARFKLRAR